MRLAFVGVALALIASGWMFGRRSAALPRMLAPQVAFSVFLILYGVIGVELYWNDDYWFLGNDYRESLAQTYLLLTVYISSFAVGVLFLPRTRAADDTSSQHATTELRGYTWAMAGTFAAYAYVVFVKITGFSSSLHNAFMMLFNATVPLVVYFAYKKRALAIVALLLFVLISGYLGFRYRVILAAVPMLFITYAHVTRPRQWVSLIGGMLAAVILVSVLGVARSYSSIPDFSRLAGMSTLELIVRGVFNDTNTMLISGAILERIEAAELFAYHNQLYYLFEYFIPSDFLPNKEYSPLLTYIADAVGRNYEKSGAIVVGPVEFFHTAGWMGVVAIGIAQGAAFAWLHKRFGQSPSISAQVVYFTMLAWLFNSFTRGYLPQNVQDLLSVSLGCWVLNKVAKQAATPTHPLYTVQRRNATGQQRNIGDI